MRTPAAFIALLLTCVDGSSADQLEGKVPKLIYPETKRLDVTEEHFGQTVVDPYRWLENKTPRTTLSGPGLTRRTPLRNPVSTRFQDGTTSTSG